MTKTATDRQRPGPKPRFTQADLVDAALALVDAEGFSALSLRAVARELGVTSMAIYTYVSSRQELSTLVVDRLIRERLSSFSWPTEWPEALRAFAESLSELIEQHPALIEAFAEGQMNTDIAMSVADHMLQLLLDGGLPVRRAGVVYATMHAIVLGHAVLRQGRHATSGAPALRAAPSTTPALDAYTADEGQLSAAPLSAMLDLIIAGISAEGGDVPAGTTTRRPTAPGS